MTGEPDPTVRSPFSDPIAAALRESEERFRAVFESSPVAMAMVEMPSQRFVQVNRRFVELTGYAENELYEMAIVDITHPDDCEREQDAIRDRLEGRLNEFVFEKRYIRKDGSIRCVVVYGEPIVVGVEHAPVSIASVIDVTERKTWDEALRNSERTARALIEATSEAAALMTVDGVILTANQRFAAVLGQPDVQAVVGKSGWDLIAPDVAESRQDKVAEAVRSGRPVTFEDVRDGRVILNSICPIVDDEGVVRTIAVFGRDVTEERRTEQALREREDKYHSLFEQSREAISIVAPDGALLDANKAWLELFGYGLDELPRVNIADLYANPSERGDFLRRMACDGFVRDEIWYRKWDGSVMLCERSVTPWRDAHGETVAFQSFVRDITRQRQMERELQSQAEQLRLLARRVEAAREDERTGIARELHDRIGQELTAIKLDLTSIQDRLNKGQRPSKQELAELARLVDLAAGDVRQISSELRPGVLDDIGLGGAIEWQVNELRRRTGIAFDLNLAVKEVTLDGARRTAVFRVFQELTTNAVTHAGARLVRVRLEQEPAGPVFLTVSDDGCGIDAEKVEDPGSLGIVGMEERLQPFGGTLRYDGVPGKGTTATVVMPIE